MRIGKQLGILAVLLVVLAMGGCSMDGKVDLTGKRIAVFIDERYLHVYAESVMNYVHKHGGETVVVALHSGTITAMDDPVRTLEVDQVVADVDVADFDALFVPGGWSYLQLIPSPQAMEFIRVFDQHKKVIFGICAGTRVMAAAGVLEGKNATGNNPAAITMGGASYSDEPVVVDGRIVTSQSSGMEAMNKIFAEAIKAMR